MNIELDGIPLVKTDQSPRGGQTEVRNIIHISTTDKRDMIGHNIPGMEGDVFQNLGRSPVVISFDGTFQGRTAKENLEILRTKFKQGTPLPFNSDLSGTADITQVLINDMRIEESSSVRGRYHYFMVLQEYKVPPPEPVMPPAQDEEAGAWQEETAEEVMESINLITGKVLDSEGNPKQGVTVKATGENGEYSVETDEEGIYRIDEATPGTYTVTVDSEEYEGIQEEVTVGSGEGSGETEGEAEGGPGETEGEVEGEPGETGRETEERSGESESSSNGAAQSSDDHQRESDEAPHSSGREDGIR
jgi:hypothetical protein